MNKPLKREQCLAASARLLEEYVPRVWSVVQRKTRVEMFKILYLEEQMTKRRRGIQRAPPATRVIIRAEN